MSLPRYKYTRYTSILPATILGSSDPAELRPHRVSRGSPCPVCAGDSKCIAIHKDTLTHVWCERVASEAMQDWGFSGHIYYHQLDHDGSTIVPFPQSRYTRRDKPLALPAVQHSIYNDIIGLLTLSDHHRAMLHARGYTDHAIAHHGFVTLPDDQHIRYGIAARLLYTHELSELVGTLGMMQDSRRSDDAIAWLPQVTGSALIQWRRNETGMITGFLYSPDIPIVDNKGKAKKHLMPPRMSPSGHPHVATPVTLTSSDIWYTEGIHKANLISDRYGCIALAAMGIGNYRAMAPVAADIDADKRARHIIAIDKDAWGGKQELALAHALYDMGYRVALSRWEGDAKGPDDALVAGASITISNWDDDRPKPKQDRRVDYIYDWQRVTGRNQGDYLNAIGAALADDVRAHIASEDTDTVLVIAAPPGTGKTHHIAAIGAETGTSLAIVFPRHSMIESVPLLLERYRHIKAPTRETCKYWDIHHAVMLTGHATLDIHKQHGKHNKCQYLEQFAERGSAVFQIAHVPTTHMNVERVDAEGETLPSMDAVVIDEMALQDWISERAITIADIRKAAAAMTTVDDTADTLLRALQHAATDCRDSDITGKPLFDLINYHCHGNLAAMLGTIDRDPIYAHFRNTRPWYKSDLAAMTREEQQADIDKLRHVVVPFLLQALFADLVKWQHGDPFNSPLRLGKYRSDEAAFYVTEKITPNAGIGPLTICDATADATILAKYLDKPIRLLRPEVSPHATTRHIAIRTGKRYGKTGLMEENGIKLNRAIKQARYVLKQADPDGVLRANGKVGLITFMGIEERLGDALGIGQAQRGHFFNMRGENRMNDCEVLLVIGTPALPSATIFAIARLLYQDDPALLDLTMYTDTAKHVYYTDPRCQHIADYLTRSELTQCAHRNRPLRFADRTVITFCSSEIDYLPATTVITELPQFAEDGSDKATRISAAVSALQARGIPLSINTLVAAAHIDKNDASQWLRLADRNVDCYLQGGYHLPIETLIGKRYPLCNAHTTSLEPAGEASSGMAGTILFTSNVACNEARDEDIPIPPAPRWRRVAQLVASGYSESQAIRIQRQESYLPQVGQ